MEELGHYILSQSFERVLAPGDESEYLTWVRGEICRVGDGSEPQIVGRTNVCVVELSRAGEEGGPTLFGLLDEHALTAPYIEGLVGSDLSLNELLEETINFAVDRILIIDRIEVLPAFRGRRLGLWAMYRLLDSLAGAGVLPVIHPWPLQFTADSIRSEGSNDMELEKLPRNRKLAFRSIRSYWARVGFKKISGSGERELWILDTSLRQPSRRDVLGEWYES